MGTVVGYHGTSRAAAEAILDEGFKASSNRFDWLGDGVYFFQDQPSRAQQWAEERYGSDGVVLEAEIDLTDCMDLLDLSWFALVSEAHDAVVASHRSARLRLPKQEGLAHGLDRLVINYAVGVLYDRGLNIRSVRGVFAEGRPAFPGSALLDRAHIQIAVRDPAAIVKVGYLGGPA